MINQEKAKWMNPLVLVVLIAILVIGGFLLGKASDGDDSNSDPASETNQTAEQTTDSSSDEEDGAVAAAAAQPNEAAPTTDPDANTSGEISESPSTIYETTLFSITAPDDWAETRKESMADFCGDGKTTEYLDLEKANGETIQVIVNDCGQGVSSDMDLTFNFTNKMVDFGNPAYKLCNAADGPFCTVGDGALTVFASKDMVGLADDNYLFFFGNNNSEALNTTMLDEQIAIIETLTQK